MAEIPHAILSRRFGDLLSGRRLVSAVFLTFRFDPGFFEQEVLPVFLDVPVSHVTDVRLAQLEDALRALRGHVAVYYDENGLEQTDHGGARLDVRRIPVRMRTGTAIFHPKNVLALVEANEPDDEGHRPRTLLVASLSANLTRAGWWKNVEVCHVEEILEGDKTRLRDDLLGFIDRLRGLADHEREHAALKDIQRFMRDTDSYEQRTGGGVLRPRFYSRRQPFCDFLKETTNGALRGMNLEVISPYFDDADTSAPLDELIKQFQPKELRVFLPRGRKGEALVRPAMFQWVLERGAFWGALPHARIKSGEAKHAEPRTVHAKVYRFFSKQPRREILFVGSVNLTRAAHSGSANLETGFLVEVIPEGRPDFWLAVDERRPKSFGSAGEQEDAAATGGTRLRVRYHWDTGLAETYWDDPRPSPALRIEAQGEDLFHVEATPPRAWTALPTETASRLGAVLKGASFLTVHGDGASPGVLLVQEEGMFKKPPLAQQLSAADILRCWSLLTPEQRARFLGDRLQPLDPAQGEDLAPAVPRAPEVDSIFRRFAGIFHAFQCLERGIEAAFAQSNHREAEYRLFGRKHDSLGSLIERVVDDGDFSDPVDRYVIIQCARQLRAWVEARWPDFWSEHTGDVVELDAQIDRAHPIREALIATSPDEMKPFLDWFDRWFLKRAEPTPTEEQS